MVKVKQILVKFSLLSLTFLSVPLLWDTQLHISRLWQRDAGQLILSSKLLTGLVSYRDNKCYLPFI